jgi:alpha-1,6-mannosyltransferase
MRIVQVANFYTPTSGGLRVVVEETGRGYLAAGHERLLIVPGSTEAMEQTPSGWRVTVPSLRLPGLGNYRILTSRRRIRRLLAAHPPDILEVSDKVSLRWLARWSRRQRVPLVLFSHERLDAILRPRVPRWFPLRATADAVNRRLSRLADQVVVTSAFAGTEFERVGAANVRRIRLGVDLDTFQPAPDGRADGTVRLVTVSRLSREKRPEVAIDTLRVLRERGLPVHLVLIGEGPMRARLGRRAAGLPVTFLGHLSDREALAGIVAAADVALFPSPAETFGLATLEALACGTPVVVPASGAAGELLDGPGSGVVSDGTAAGMADAIAALLAIPEARRRSAARAAAQRYPWARTVAALLDGYATLGSAPGPPPPAR